jgi:uncharacterized glyoxalase superfamily protein PhnB
MIMPIINELFANKRHTDIICIILFLEVIMPDNNSISYFEVEDEATGYLFYKQSGVPQGYRVRFAGDTPASAEKLNVTRADRVGESTMNAHFDIDGDRVHLMSNRTQRPVVVINGQQSKTRYTDYSRDARYAETIAWLIQKVESGEIMQLDPKIGQINGHGGRHNPALSDVKALYNDHNGNAYAVMAAPASALGAGAPAELVKIDSSGKMSYYSGTIVESNEAGIRLNTTRGEFYFDTALKE